MERFSLFFVLILCSCEHFLRWAKFFDRDSPTLHVGIDVTHPVQGRGGNSIATVVANVDIEGSRYKIYDLFTLCFFKIFDSDTRSL